jgi:hypothetical protein
MDNSKTVLTLVMFNLSETKFENFENIGLDDKTITRTPTSDLLILKKAITVYLKSKKNKRKCTSFLTVLKLISNELKFRESFSDEYKELKCCLMREISDGKLPKTRKCSEEKSLLGRKTSSKPSIHEIQIPSFFNDKNKLVKPVVNNELEAPSSKSNFYKGKIVITLDFEKGLLIEKNDFDLSSDYETYISPPKKQNFEKGLKEIELVNAVFEPLLEDLFFTLD